MGHAKEIVTLDVYADKRSIISEGIPEIEAYMAEVLPSKDEEHAFKNELRRIVVDVRDYLD